MTVRNNASMGWCLDQMAGFPGASCTCRSCTPADLLLPPSFPQGIHIWDGNGSREYLDSIGLSHR